MELEKIDTANDNVVDELFTKMQQIFLKTAHPITKQELKNPNKEFFWAKQDGQTIGFAGLTHKTPTLVETIKTAIYDEHKGKGLGKLLSQKMEKMLADRGIKKIMSTIYTHNLHMIAIKLNQGYKIEGHHPSHEAPGWDEYSLGKVLN